MRASTRQRGSVLLMVIGLLTVIAMLGSMLLLVARLDRQTTQAQATVAAEDHVAEGILDRLLADRVADLHINGAGGVYGDLGTDPLVAERFMIDYPADPSGYDPALACIERVLEPVGGTLIWRHISDLSGTGETLFNNVAADPNSLVDTDGDTVPDARLFPTGVLDRDGKEFYAAVRMIDAGGLVNANIAGTAADAGGNPVIARVADRNRVMDPSYVALEGVLSTGTSAQEVVMERVTGPYDMGDMLALAWLKGNMAANGRLFKAAGGDFTGARDSLTTLSAAHGTLSPLWAYVNPPGPRIKVNPNLATRQDLYAAFFDLLRANDKADPDENRRKAAQLTVNLIDYLDDNRDPNRIDASGLDSTNFPTDSWFYGIERHPFVSKVFRRLEYRGIDGDGNPIIEETAAAIELINPYVNEIDLAQYSINGTSLTGKIAGNGGRFVIRSNDTVQIDPGLDTDSQMDLSGLSTGTAVKITWQHPTEPWAEGVCVDETPLVKPNDPTEEVQATWSAKFRDDRLNLARYSLALYAERRWDPKDPGDPVPDPVTYDYTSTEADAPKMGLANPHLPEDDGRRAPIYVRNGPMICLGDMMRLFTVGPDLNEPLSKKLGGSSAQLLPWTDSIPTPPPPFGPRVPLGCLVSEFFNLLPIDDPSGTIGGMVNINTAPRKVLECLPGLAALSAGNRQALAEEIIAYRDKGQVGARNYSNRAGAGATGIDGLREQPGFACASEVAIPLGLAVGGAINNIYGNTPPGNYFVGEPVSTANDDGVPVNTSTWTAVEGDPVKQHILYAWLSNQVTVRSNTFIVYIRVQLGDDPNQTRYRNYVAVIDRSNCRTAADRPRVLLFTELR